MRQGSLFPESEPTRSRWWQAPKASCPICGEDYAREMVHGAGVCDAPIEFWYRSRFEMHVHHPAQMAVIRGIQ